MTMVQKYPWATPIWKIFLGLAIAFGILIPWVWYYGDMVLGYAFLANTIVFVFAMLTFAMIAEDEKRINE